jgi:hypothetical protein
LLQKACLLNGLCELLVSVSCPPCCSLNRMFLSLVDVVPATPRRSLNNSFLSLARRAAHCIALFFLLPTSCPPCRSLYRSFLSPTDALPAAPLAESLVCFSFRRLARRAARCIARLFLLTTPRPPRRLLNRSFVSPADATPAAPLTESLVSLSFRRLARRTAR